jgi:hypothetical protein
VFLPIMHIMDIHVTSYDDVERLETEICRLLRCSRGKCSAMYTQPFIELRGALLGGVGADRVVYMPEGLVLRTSGACVQLSWAYADSDTVIPVVKTALELLPPI